MNLLLFACEDSIDTQEEWNEFNRSLLQVKPSGGSRGRIGRGPSFWRSFFFIFGFPPPPPPIPRSATFSGLARHRGISIPRPPFSQILDPPLKSAGLL